MYGGCSSHGGSNHLFLPTGLLQHLSGEAVVLIEHSTSASLNAIYPGEITDTLTPLPRITRMLEAMGHSGRIFSAEMMRCSGPDHTTPNGADGAPFTPFTLPGAELRRVLAEAKARNESFALEYTRLERAPIFARDTPAPVPEVGVSYRWDAAWRVARCAYTNRATAATLGECTADEVALLPPKGWLYSKFLLHTPRPRVGDDWDVGCRP